MNRQYSQNLVTTPNTPVYQKQKIYLSPRHQPQHQISSPEYYKNNLNNVSPRVSTAATNGATVPGTKFPFINKIDTRKNQRSKSAKRNIIVTPSSKPDPNSSPEKKIVEVEVRRKQQKKSLFQNKPSSGPINQTNSGGKPKQQSIQHSQAKQQPAHNKIYCSQEQVVNLIQGKISKELDKMVVNKRILDANIKQLKEGVQFYYDKLQERIRSYRRLDYDKIKEYEKSCIRHIHQYESIFNKSMGDIVSIRSDYSRDKTITHQNMIGILENVLRSYENQKVEKLHYVYKDLASFASYECISTLSHTDPSPLIPSDPLIKFDTKLDVKQVVSDNFIVNNPEFSFIDISYPKGV